MEQHGSAHNRLWPIGPPNSSISYMANWHSRYLSRRLSSKRSACEFGLHARRKVGQLWSRGCLGSALLVVVKGKADYFFSLPDLDLDVISREITSFVTARFSSYRTVGSSYDRRLRNKWPAYGFYWTFWKLEQTIRLSRLYKYMMPLKWFHSWLGLNALFISCPTDVCDFNFVVHIVAAQFITVWTF